MFQAQENEVRGRLATLTPRETEVMKRVVRGHANKVIALDLGDTSQRTVENRYIAHATRKLKMRSLADLVSTVGKILVPTSLAIRRTAQ